VLPGSDDGLSLKKSSRLELLRSLVEEKVVPGSDEA